MTWQQEDYVGRCHGLVISLMDVLTAEECAEVEHLIEHGEAPDAMHALAWIIVSGGKRVSTETIAAIRDLAAGLVPEEHMPPDLDSYAVPED